MEEDILQSVPRMAVFERQIDIDYPDAQKLIEWGHAQHAVNVMFNTILEQALFQTA